MSRIRIRLAKGPEVKYISHLDLARAVERAIRRAGLPVAFSEGFNPRPKIAFASALAVGVTSEAEYVDIETSRPVSAERFRAGLAAVLPAGIRPLEARPVPTREPALMAVVDVASYIIDLVPGEESAGAVAAFDGAAVVGDLKGFLSREEIFYTKQGKSGPREVNARPLIIELRVISVAPALARLEATLHTGSRGTLRPEDLAGIMARELPALAGCQVRGIHRRGLYISSPEGLRAPWPATAPIPSRYLED